jgi:peptidoglycan/LPS O-acetylase OafA/YrhL
MLAAASSTPDPFNPGYAVICLVVALAVLRGLSRRPSTPAPPSRFVAIDGLRGYLAFFVFLHHSAFWYLFVKTGGWDIPPSHLFVHFGQSSVLLFFMITGLLFFAKIRASQRAPVDWLRLYVSRVLRLTPLYLFLLGLLGTVVAVETGFTLREPGLLLARHVLHWLAFCCFDSPALNGFGSTWQITAGVAWSLRLEWLFYISLPLLACAVAPRRYLLFSAIALLLFVFNSEFYKTTVLFAFGSGMFAAVCAEEPRVQRLARSWWGAIFVVAPLVFAVARFPVAYVWGPLFPLPEDFYVLALLTIAFVAIAAGNTIFGILSHPLSKALGDLSYGIYLLHGVVLYVTFRFIVGLQRAASLSLFQYWSIIAACGAFVTILAWLVFRYIERPSLRLTGGITRWLRKLGERARISQRPQPDPARAAVAERALSE